MFNWLSINMKNKPLITIRKKTLLLFLILLFFDSIKTSNKVFSTDNLNLSKKVYEKKKIMNISLETQEISWERINKKKYEEIIWERFNTNKFDENFFEFKNKQEKTYTLNSLNRSIVFNNNLIGPDISWIVPNGFKWNKKYKFDFSFRGHNTVIPEPKEKNFFGWNNGDALGLISYQLLDNEKTSFGLNLGIRSLYKGNQAAGGSTSIGEGISSGFRWDYAITDTSGLAFGAEQLIHYDDKTDSGRNLYITASKGWWSSKDKDMDLFPLYIATAGLGTGRMAVGTVKGLCSKKISSGTEFVHRDLCWSPIFSLASVWNHKLSTFFEYNSRFFILGTSLAPSQNVPLRGTFALILSDHVDNYKLHNFDELNWVFNLSIGL